MASEKLLESVSLAETLIRQNGFKQEYADALFQYGRYIIEVEKDRENGLRALSLARGCLDGLINKTTGADFWELLKYCKANDVTYDVITLYYDILLVEAQNRVLDSYFIYLEKNRIPKEMFYLPKRRHFIKLGIIQGLQDMLDDKLDILTISMPPSTQKCQPLYSKVLTPNGFVQMGDLSVGDDVISGTGNKSKIVGVYPQGKKQVYEITLENKAKCRCSDDHLWYVRNYYFANKYKDKVVEFSEIICNPNKFLIPIYSEGKQFWLRIAKIEYVGCEECQCIYIDDPSHLYITDDFIVTHNTTCEKFFASGIMGWYPEEFSLFFSHSADITRMFYDGVLDIISNSDEYTWAEIFPDAKITGTNAKAESININKYKPFANLQCTSRGSSNAGKVRASGGGFLYVDDLISKIEEALNKDYLDKLWGVYSVDARQRKMDGAKEIHIATRWSVHDVIGRLQRLYEGNDRCRFIAVPDIDPVTGKSNFDYEFNGFTEEFFHDQELAMDDISYKCLYKNDPIEREGLLYHDDELRRFVDLPTREPDAILAVCDTKSKGSDFLVLPVMYQYDNDYYMVDCICSDDSNYGVQYGRMANMLLSHGVQQCEFESNAGGDRVAYEVEQLVKENGGRCNITTKPTETNKETRIIVNADWVKKNCLFKIKDGISPRTDYHTFMSWLLSYSVVGKNTHDDVPDCMANFALFVQAKFNIRKAVIRRSPI